MHDVLERVFSELGGPLTPDSLARAREILDGVLRGSPARAEIRSRSASAVRRSSGPARCARSKPICAATSSTRRGPAVAGDAYALELRFGFDDVPESLPALALGDGDERVLVRGVIDRVDTDGTGAAVVRDYKSGAGRAAHPAARWVADRQLQVALYLLVVRELTELDPVGGFYQPLARR